MVGKMKSTTIRFAAANVAACALILYAGAETNAVEKTVVASEAKTDDAAKTLVPADMPAIRPSLRARSRAQPSASSSETTQM